MTARHPRTPNLNIPYRSRAEYEPVDLERLRPKGSYRELIRKRTHTIDELVAKYGRIPPDLLRPRPCPTCGSESAAVELEKDHLTIVRCGECDLVYVTPIFDEAHYRAVYGSAEYQQIMRDLGESSHEYRTERFGRERVAIMARHLDIEGPARYLDVGCSTGFVVEAARDAGWSAVGIDLNPSAIAFGQGRGLDLRVGDLDSCAFPAASFDAVSLFDVLEHLPNPGDVLRRCVTLLRPAGILFLYVPNYDSASRLLMGADAHFIWPTHHLNYYTPGTITGTLARFGLDVAWLATEGLDVADYIWYRREMRGDDTAVLEELADTLQFLANAGAYGKNLRVIARRHAGAAA
jgi:2-polyprenyl-3-methyl-5-hydroxy-6-metoxy-1,4-benzoquinol methylase